MYSKKQIRSASILASFLFLLISTWSVYYHEIWLDEAYHYLLARDSTTLTQLFRNGNSSGHPLLWNVVLMYYKLLFPGVAAMQYLHVLIATICVFLIFRFSPLSIYEKIAVCFSYYFIYEYSTISKNYIFGFALIFFSLVLHDKKQSLGLIGLVLALAANVHLFTLFVAVFVFIYCNQNRLKESKQNKNYIGVFIFSMGVVISIFQFIPPMEIVNLYRSYDSSPFFSAERFGRSMAALNNGLLNIPDYRLSNFWNSNLLFNISRILAYISSALFAYLMFQNFKQSRRILLLFFGPTCCILFFVYCAPLATGIRYWGYFFMLLIICTWCFRKEKASSLLNPYLLLILAGIQLVVAVPAIAADYKHPFSNAKLAAQSIAIHGLERFPLFVQKLALGPALSAYAGKPIYYPSNKSFESFSYNIKHTDYSARMFVDESIVDLEKMSNDTCVLVLNNEIPHDMISNYPLTEIALHKGAIFTSENYFLYLLVREQK